MTQNGNGSSKYGSLVASGYLRRYIMLRGTFPLLYVDLWTRKFLITALEI